VLVDRERGEGLWPRRAAASDPGVARGTEGDAGTDRDGGSEFKSGIANLKCVRLGFLGRYVGREVWP